MTPSIVAHRYARALFELAAESGQVSPIAQQLQAVAEAYGACEELRSVLSDPIVDDDKRIKILGSLCQRLGLSPLVQNALGLLQARSRLSALPDIVESYLQLADEQAGLIKASVSSAIPLSDQQLQTLKGELERLTGRKIALERHHEPALLAGVVARIGDHVIDASLLGRLEELAQKLRESPA
jgi:F-type H+-transporting ATPase subunit delta